HAAPQPRSGSPRPLSAKSPTLGTLEPGQRSIESLIKCKPQLAVVELSHGGCRAPGCDQPPSSPDPAIGVGPRVVLGRDRRSFRHQLARHLPEPSGARGCGARKVSPPRYDPAISRQPPCCPSPECDPQV